MPMLASDLNNPEFINPQNPDTMLYVEFYLDNPLDKWASDQKSYDEGRKCAVLKHKTSVPYVKIMKPGDNTTLIVQQVRDDHKRRFPQQWLSFAVDNSLIEQQIQGWRIEEWPHLNADQVRDLKHMRFNTVEQIAAASDASVQGMGVMGTGLRIEAQKALRERVGETARAESAAKDQRIAELEEAQKKMQETLDKLLARKSKAGKTAEA